MREYCLQFERSILVQFAAALGAVSLAVAARESRAATLSSVPMQGGMVMPMVSYQSADNRLHIQMPATVPQLLPLLVSNPGDRFDPADPWFDALDPGGRGLAFSRRYGFVMDADTDLLPAGTEIWLRKLSGSAGLSAYRYQESEPKALEPIFGTDGVTNALHWTGMMFHPVFAAPPGTNHFTATFEAFLLETATGREVPGSSSGPLEFHWTEVPDGRPGLDIGTRIVVAWSAGATNWVLEGASSPVAGVWTPVTNLPVTLGGQSAVVLDPGETRSFFRMKLSP